MKILGIVCSPRTKANTEIIVKESLEGAREAGADIELLTVNDKEIKPCDGCRACVASGECHIKDDMQVVYDKLLEADGIILGSPVYFWTVTAQAKAIIDRSYALYHEFRLRDKIGGAIAVATNRGRFNALTEINNFFLGHKIIPIGLGIEGRGGREKEKIREEIDALRKARAMGKDMVERIR